MRAPAPWLRNRSASPPGKVLGSFTLACALLSYVLVRITIRAAADYGVAEYAQQLVMSVLVLELVPLAAALFVALRSGAAIATEASLKV